MTAPLSAAYWERPRKINGIFMPSPTNLESAQARFWTRVEKTTSCWLWRGSVTHWGYGQVTINYRNYRPHRLAYEWLVGPIPKHLQLDHLCRNKLCVNPAHLEAVTGQTNTLRGYGPSAQQARRAHCVRGHPFDILRPYGRYCSRCERAKAALYYVRHRDRKLARDRDRYRRKREAPTQ